MKVLILCDAIPTRYSLGVRSMGRVPRDYDFKHISRYNIKWMSHGGVNKVAFYARNIGGRNVLPGSLSPN